ncbi:S-adenosylmethionine decarboxylase [Dipodascopsis tothii]|uniref:S-adenosylmethionine decarboxylase n=1 Tax=Dipodascopsis tothii TaxID=44089 RepID=UPI0034CDC5D3
MVVSVPEDTTVYSINHETSMNLDSTNAFEGPEKLLEVWFAPDRFHLPPTMPVNGLKSVSRPQWEEMLDLVHCKVLSVIDTPDMDAYLLSESSMFVFPHKIILKTCGTTTLLQGLPRLLEIAKGQAGFPADREPWRVFYSRKNFMFPDKQPPPHRSWTDEVKCLDSHFSNGSAYMVGRMNSEHHWYLYSTSPNEDSYAYLSPDESESETEAETQATFEDETLEVLMTGLSEAKAAQFYTAGDGDAAMADADKDGDKAEGTDPGHALGAVVTKDCGLGALYPETRVDGFSFSPCGYSANGVHKSTKNYFTVHVTPEPFCSYASFESNIPSAVAGMTSLDVVNYVVNIFEPRNFSVTMFETKGKKDSFVRSSLSKGLRGSVKTLGGPRALEIPGYRRIDRIVYDLDAYDLVFLAYEQA